MPSTSTNNMTAACACGQVALQLNGKPIVCLACYCDDCQRGSRRIETLPHAQPVLDPDGGTAYVLYRKDRVECVQGAPLLQRHKLDERSATYRVVAHCCDSALYMGFDDARQWVPVYRARIDSGKAPPLQMRICTKFKPEGSRIPDDVNSHRGYPLGFLARLFAAWVPMLLQRPRPA